MVTRLMKYRFVMSCCLCLLLSVATAQALAGDTNGTTVRDKAVSNMTNAQTNTAYDRSTGIVGLQAMNNTHDFSVTAHNICRYIDVAMTPGGQGILIPFATPSEWIKGTGNSGFLATTANRSFVRLDFCRPATTQSATYIGTGGISDPSSLVAGQQTTDTYSFWQKRVETRLDDAAYALSLTEKRAEEFNLSRKDCLGNTPYPDGTVRNPCYTWSWVEQITATFIDAIGKTRVEAAAAAKAVPVQDSSNNWSYTLARTACTGPHPSPNPVGTSNDGRQGMTSNTCPPPFQPPVLRACTPQQHNTKHWQLASSGNTRDLHDCGPGFIEDPTRRYTFDTEAEYWCFDGTDYPTGNTRDINGVTSGLCKPITNGEVGPDHTKSFPTLTSNDPGLCKTGIVADFATSSTGWTWTCKGINTGTDAHGYADKAVTLVLTCNAASSQLSGGGSVTTACSKYNSNNNTCEGTNTWTAVNGCCVPNQPNNQSFTVNGFAVPGCNAQPTCVAGWGPIVGLYSEDRTAGCTADMNVTGKCDDADGSQGGHAASSKGNVQECWTSTGPGNVCKVYGRRCGSYVSCTQSTETRTTTPCPSGQTGTITEQRTKDTGNVCGAYGDWTVVSNTCAAPPVCDMDLTHETVKSSSPPSAGNAAASVCGSVSGYTYTGYDDEGINDYTTGKTRAINCHYHSTAASCNVSSPPAPTCTPGYEDRNGSCPAGQTGTVIERRNTNVGGTCGKYGSWTTYSGTCAPTVTYHWDEGQWQAGSCSAAYTVPENFCVEQCTGSGCTGSNGSGEDLGNGSDAICSTSAYSYITSAVVNGHCTYQSIEPGVSTLDSDQYPPCDEAGANNNGKCLTNVDFHETQSGQTSTIFYGRECNSAGNNVPPQPRIDGVCGTANGTITASPPTGNLCQAGTPTAVQSYPQGTAGHQRTVHGWQCIAQGNGIHAYCAAYSSNP